MQMQRREETKTEDKHRHDESSHAGRPPTMQLTPHRSEIQSRNGQRPLGLSTLSSLAFGFVLVNYPARLRPIPVPRSGRLRCHSHFINEIPGQLLAYSSPFLVLAYVGNLGKLTSKMQ
jgi:hypothetical protein